MFFRVLGVVAILSVGACASPYVAKPFDRAASGVQVISLVDDSLPESAMAYEVASAGSNFGLIGVLVDAGIQASRENAVNEALDGAGFDAEAVMEAQIVSALSVHGYQVAVLEGTEREKREFLEAYPTAPEGVDAYLDLVVSQYGYLSAGAFQPFRPSIDATVRLVSVENGATLMENRIVYNGLYPPDGVITLSPNVDYAFQNRAEMLADPTRLAAGLDDALNEVARTAAQLMR